MNKLTKFAILSAAIGALVGCSVTIALQRMQKPSELTNDELIKEFYLVENAAHVSPHSIRRSMDTGKKDFVLVDLRSPQEYKREHIIGAVNISAYSDPNTSAYEEKDRIIGQFRDLISKSHGKDIITYCYSIPCMTGRKVGKLLAENGIYVKTLGVGWNEWRHFWKLWNHEHEWKRTNPDDYISKGEDPGEPKMREAPTPCGTGDFAC